MQMYLCVPPLFVSQSVPLSRLGQRGAFGYPPSWMGLFFNVKRYPVKNLVYEVAVSKLKFMFGLLLPTIKSEVVDKH